jgi:hypothetical protein
MRTAFYNYRVATKEEKVAIKKQIQELWNNFKKEERTKFMIDAYNALFQDNK